MITWLSDSGKWTQTELNIATTMGESLQIISLNLGVNNLFLCNRDTIVMAGFFFIFHYNHHQTLVFQLDFFLIQFPRVYYVTVSRVDVKAPSWTKCILRTKFAKSCKNTVQERLFGDVDRNHCFRRNFRKFPAEFIWWNSLLTSCPSLKANPTTKHINLYTYKKYWLWKWSVIKNCYINSSNLILT